MTIQESHQESQPGKSHANNLWTEAEIAELRQLAGRNITASRIAAAFPGKSRNAILGKLFRLGIHLRLASEQASRAYDSFWNRDNNLRKLKGFYESPLGYSYTEMAHNFGVGLSTIRRGLARMEKELGVRGLKPRPRVYGAAAARVRRRGPKTGRQVQPIMVDIADDDISHAVTITRLDRPPGMKSCRWPVKGVGLSMLYCGRMAIPECPYCASHARRAYART